MPPKRLAILALAVLIAFVSGCEKKEQEEEPEEEPPSPQEIATKIIRDVGLNSPVPPPNPSLPPSAADKFKQQLTQIKSQHSATPEGKEALDIVADKLSDRTRSMAQAAEAGHDVWEHVLVLCEAYKIFEPDSKRFNTTRERAIIQLKKPKINLKGFTTLKGITEAHVDVTLPLEDKTETMRIREGEEFHGLKFLEIVGKNHGIRLEYLETGEVYTVEKN